MRTLLVFVTFAIILYVGFSLMLYLLQERMVFLPHLPGRTLDATPQSIQLDYADAWIDTEDGERLHGWHIPATAARGTVLFFHGNAGNISHRMESILIFNRLGLNVLIVDYRGYGQSSGKAGEQGTYRDAQASWDYLVNDLRVPPEKTVIFGRSMGGAVGAWLASRPGVEPAGLIIESCFSSGLDMGKRLYPVLPVRLITRIDYPVKDYVTKVQAPLLVVHSRDDEIIPFDMGRAIFDAAPGPKAFFELRGDHNAGFWISQETYVPALDEFLTGVLGPINEISERQGTLVWEPPGSPVQLQ
ncbi:MAG: alpha/beta hydrolase [Gammaproteobacteria bacterium]|nr:alpha/beta hydrolase [Gammaproteobacteria bacterium]